MQHEKVTLQNTTPLIFLQVDGNAPIATRSWRPCSLFAFQMGGQTLTFEMKEAQSFLDLVFESSFMRRCRALGGILEGR